MSIGVVKAKENNQHKAQAILNSVQIAWHQEINSKIAKLNLTPEGDVILNQFLTVIELKNA
ncbi:MAG: hypothetical protein WCK78_11315 [Paludibacter sp.]